jgi:RNA polymerase sigma-70 factor, ECF subfamily
MKRAEVSSRGGSVTGVDDGWVVRAPELARFELLFREHADAVLAYAARRTDPDAAQEVVAETFLVAWRRLAVVPDPALPWLLGVARRVLANERRSSKRGQALTLRLVREPRRHAHEPTDEVDERLSAQAALGLLPPHEREAIELLAWEGLSTAEAAQVLGCSRGVLAVRVYRARRRLRSHAQGHSDSPPLGRASEGRDHHRAHTGENAKEAR